MSYLEEPGPDHPVHDPSPYRTPDVPTPEPEYMLKSEGMLRVQGVHRAAYYVLCVAVIITQLTLAYVTRTAFQRINAMSEQVEKVQVNTDDGLCHEGLPVNKVCPHHEHQFIVTSELRGETYAPLYVCKCPR